jgi:hypothetical protein
VLCAGLKLQSGDASGTLGLVNAKEASDLDIPLLLCLELSIPVPADAACTFSATRQSQASEFHFFVAFVSFCSKEPLLTSVSLSEAQTEVMRDNVHPIGKVKSMGTKPLNPRIQCEDLATLFFGGCDKPIKQKLAESFGTVIAIGNKVVDVHVFSVRQVLAVSISRHRANYLFRFAIGQ